MSSTREKKALARKRLMENRTSSLLHGSKRTDQYEVPEEEDVYEVLEEDDYQHLVTQRKQCEDFVVDDDGLGYHDNGEENAYDDEVVFASNSKGGGANTNSNSKRKKSSFTSEALQKAKQTTALLKSSDQTTKPESNSTMYKFLKRGNAASAANPFANTKAGNSDVGMKRNVLESLLDGLDDEVTPLPRKRSARKSGNRGSSAAGGYSHSSSKKRRERGAYGKVKREIFKDDDEMKPVRYGQEEEEEVTEVAFDPEEAAEEELPSVSQNVDMEEVSPEPMPSSDAKDDAKEEEETLEAPASAPAPKKARIAFATKKIKPKAPPVAPPVPAVSSPVPTKREREPSSNTMSTPSAMVSMIQPDAMNAASPAPMTPSHSPMKSTLHSILQTVPAVPAEGDAEVAPPQTYVDMYWMDAIPSRNGDSLTLYGKTKLPNTSKYASIAIQVKNTVRNLFILPKPNANLLDVHTEIQALLQPNLIPLRDGCSWASKVVKRKYAFGDASIPKNDDLEVLKVVYRAEFPPPPNDVCSKGGTHFSQILGANSSPLELVLVKRKMMGPCWIRIANPELSNSNMSWCKFEGVIDTPKHITRLDLVKGDVEVPPPPPVVALSLKFKTILHPKTQTPEIVSVSAVCHPNLPLDKATDWNGADVAQLSLLRPLGPIAASVGGLPQFPHDFDWTLEKEFGNGSGGGLQKMSNERSLLSRLLAQIGLWDPDVILGHYTYGHDMPVLLRRCSELKVGLWSKLGRRRRMQNVPSAKGMSGGDWVVSEAIAGRILCDTYLAAKEHLGSSTTYSLTYLSKTQLKLTQPRVEIEPVDIPQYYQTSATLIQLAKHTLLDAQLVLRLALRMQVLPLTCQLTQIAGNIWNRTLKGQRAERNEYLLLHEFHREKYIPPEKLTRSRRELRKAEGAGSYSGGLVLEPKRGLYDTYVLLLDFNSLYPSLIQEYNLCFTTVEWAAHNSKIRDAKDAAARAKEENGEVVTVDTSSLPEPPSPSLPTGILPKILKTIVSRRTNVKKLLKSCTDPQKRTEYDIRQKALKLTANSMYGCLGFSQSRFFAQPIAALITALGREVLQKTVEVAEESVGLEVIYGDTDSIMINTRIRDPAQWDEVSILAKKVLQKVNQRYHTLELDCDGVYKPMLLLKKKKYAAKMVEKAPDGTLTETLERKGLDQVRRDWCLQSKQSGNYILDQILSGEDPEAVILKIHAHLAQLGKDMREGKMELEKFVITKGLTKHPSDYPDGRSLPHVFVAQSMLKASRAVNMGDHIPYVITAPIPPPASEVKPEEDSKLPKVAPKALTWVERARHPDEIRRSEGLLIPDYEWYITHQILPPVTRLCEPMEGTSQQALATQLGLDANQYSKGPANNGQPKELQDEELVNYQPVHTLPDEERFESVQKLELKCRSCHVTSSFPGVFHCTSTPLNTLQLTSGLSCVNPTCPSPNLWGYPSPTELQSRISNRLCLSIRKSVGQYYSQTTVCDDVTCGLRTRQCSVLGSLCLERGCHGRLVPEYSERELHTQICYWESLFDEEHAVRQLTLGKTKSPEILGELKELTRKFGTTDGLCKQYLSREDRVLLGDLKGEVRRYKERSGYNWVEKGLWSDLFGSVGGTSGTSANAKGVNAKDTKRVKTEKGLGAILAAC